MPDRDTSSLLLSDRPSLQTPRSILRQSQRTDRQHLHADYYTCPPSLTPSRIKLGDPRHCLASVPVPDINMERDRLLRACGHPPLIVSPCTPQSSDGQGIDISTLPPAPKWPYQEVLLRLKNILRAEGMNIKDYLDVEDIEMLYARDVEERALREQSREGVARMRSGLEAPDWAVNAHVFGAPLRETILIASTPVILSNSRHDLPIALYVTIEELYRTGIYQPGLFRDFPDRKRHMDLIRIFNSAPAFGADVSLTSDTTSVVAAVLSTFLKNLPEPLLGEPLFEPIWNWVVRPTVQRQEARQKRAESLEEDAREEFYRTGIRPHRALLRDATLRHAEDVEAEAVEAEARVPILQLLLRLLPTHRLSTLYYVCAFFSMVPLSPDNGLSLDDIARLFAQPLLGGARGAARHVFTWILRRWELIADRLLEAEAWPIEPTLSNSGPEPWHASERGIDKGYQRSRRVSLASSHFDVSEASATLYHNSGSGSGSSEGDGEIRIKGEKGRSKQTQAQSIDWGLPKLTPQLSHFRRASDSCLQLPPLSFARESTEAQVHAAGDIVRARFSSASEGLSLKKRESSRVEGKAADETSLWTQLAKARQECDEALRMVQTLRTVLEP